MFYSYSYSSFFDCYHFLVRYSQPQAGIFVVLDKLTLYFAFVSNNNKHYSLTFTFFITLCLPNVK